jgi:hypothetical protein
MTPTGSSSARLGITRRSTGRTFGPGLGQELSLPRADEALYEVRRRQGPGGVQARPQDGRYPQCRVCEKEWRKANAERLKAYKRAWNRANPDKKRAHDRRYREKNLAKDAHPYRDRKRAQDRRYRQRKRARLSDAPPEGVDG